MGKIVTVPLSELKTNLFVRVKLDDDRVIMFWEMLNDGQELPPIQITKDFEVIDGRHRIEAHDYAKKTEIRAEIVEVKNQTDLIVQAIAANIGGSLPPSKEDYELAIKLLLEQGLNRKKIRELLKLPTDLGIKWVDNVQSKVTRQKIQAATDAVANGGLTVAQAAEKYGVDVDKVKEALTGRKKKQKTDGISNVQREMTNRFKSFSQSNAGTLKKLLKLVEDADVSPDQAQEIIEHLKRLLNQASRNVIKWDERFQAQYTKDAK